jgi:hypothetical protein
MASSAYDTYGALSIKNVKMDESGMKMYNASDDTKFCEVKANAPTGQHVLTLPNETGTFLTSASSVAGAKVNITAETAVDALVNADQFLLYDVSASANKKITAQALATFCASGSGLPTGNTPANILVANGSGDFQSVAMSGNATINASGAVSIANNSVSNEMLQGSIAYGKLNLNNAVQNGDLAGSIQYNKLSLTNSVVNGDLAGSIANDKISALNGVSAGTASASRAVVLDSSKDVAGLESVGLATLAFAGDQWRLKVSGGAIVMEFKDGGSWVVKHTFSSA